MSTSDKLVTIKTEPLSFVKNLSVEYSPNIEDHFPFPTVREAQRRAMSAIVRAKEEGKKFVIIEAPTGIGKCLGRGTLVLMFDGSLREVEGLQIGDQLMGPDSKPRTILSLTQGTGEMFEISSDTKKKTSHFESYVVNGDHVLALKYSGEISQGQSSDPDTVYHRKFVIGDHLELSVSDYIQKCKWFKHCVKGYKVGVEFPESPLTVDPYFLGLWLGDGSSDSSEITTADEEIKKYIYEVAAQYGLGVTVDDRKDESDCPSYHISRGRNNKEENGLLIQMQNLKVINNKHIPMNYLINSRSNRLKLLAGLVDSDGYVSSGTYEIATKWAHLANQIRYLARSLGFAAQFEMKWVKNQSEKRFKSYVLTFYGTGLEELPVLLPRKKSQSRKQIKDALRSGLNVVSKGLGDYFGFTLNGDGLFLLGDFTVTHNSGIAIAAASWAKTWNAPGYEPGAYILTPQKILAQQYMNDFANFGLLELRGKANYHCDTFDTDCDSGALMNDSTEGGDNRTTCPSCPYKLAKKAFIANSLGTTNFAYYLNETQYAGQLPRRNMLVLDEGHNTESNLLNFADTVISKWRMKEIGLGALPVFKPGENIACRDWLFHTFIPQCQQFMSELENQVDEAKFEGRKEDALKLVKKLDNYDKYICRLNRFMNSDDLSNWLCFTTEDDEKRDTQAEILIKPLTATLVADEILFRKASMIVIMSATILDIVTFMRSLGIKDEEAVVLTLPSEFPVENRPIYYKPVGKMNWNEREATMPRMLKFIEKIMDKYEGKKGIIHTHSYAFNKAITAYLRNTKHANRIITHTGIPGSRDAAVAEHFERPDATVLISPSLNEGLDLKEDLARFCILIKVPFAFLDPYTKARMRRDPAWYTLQASLTMIQATGRIIRTKDDKGHCFILDADFSSFLNRARLPTWWTDALVF